MAGAWTRRGFGFAAGAALCLLAARPGLAEGAEKPPKAALTAKGFDLALLDPVDGVSLRAYAHAAFDAFAGDEPDIGKVAARHGMTEAQFNQVGAAFTERMRKDATYTLIDIYGAYFIETAGGKYAADVAHSVIEGGPLREQAPMAWDQYLELTSFYGRNAPNAKDKTRKSYDEILKLKGLTFVDYQIVGAWFGRRMRLGGAP